MPSSVFSLQPELPFDDFSLTAAQLEDIKNEQSRIIMPVLNGEKTGLYKAFKDFDEKGVFDIRGSSIDLNKDGGLSETGWKQLRAAMDIYRSKKFETFRYILVDRSGTIVDQLALTCYLPNFCLSSIPGNETCKKIISRAEDMDCMIVACHNHPSGDTRPSEADIDTTNDLYHNFTTASGNTKFLGHIILDHETFSYAVPDPFRKECVWQTAVISDRTLDRFVIPDGPDFMNSKITPASLLTVATEINDRYTWNDNYVPVIFVSNSFKVNALQYFSKDIFRNESHTLKDELMLSAFDSGSTMAFPVITESLWNRISGKERQEIENLLKKHVETGVFLDAAIIEDSYYGFSVADKYGINSNDKKRFFTPDDLRKSEITSTWEPYINKKLFADSRDDVSVESKVAASESQHRYENEGDYMKEDYIAKVDHFPWTMYSWTLMGGEKPSEIPPEKFDKYMQSFLSTFEKTCVYADADEKQDLRGTFLLLSDAYFTWQNNDTYYLKQKGIDLSPEDLFKTRVVLFDCYSRYVAANHWNNNTKQFSPDTCNYPGGFSEYIISKKESEQEKTNTIVDSAEPQRVEKGLFSESQFDRELSDYAAGKLPKNHIFSLGLPGEILRKCGFPEGQRIELSGTHLEFKAKLNRHPFELKEIAGLDKALQQPVAVFSYGDKAKSQNVVVSIEHEGKNFLAGVHFNQMKNGFEISSIRTLFPKENYEWLNWINQGKMIYGDKEKLQALIAQQRMNFADVSGQVVQSPLHERCLESADNILQKFGDVKDIFTDGSSFYAEIKEKSDIEQKFFGYYTEKGNLDARITAEYEAEEFYSALKSGNQEKIHEYTDNDEFHEVYELAREIYLTRSSQSIETSTENNKKSPATVEVDGRTVELKDGLEEGFRNAYRKLDKVLAANESLVRENEKLRKQFSRVTERK